MCIAHAQRVRITAAQTNTTHVKMEITLFPFWGRLSPGGRDRETGRECERGRDKMTKLLQRKLAY